MSEILVLDLETGGLDPKKHGICTISLKKYAMPIYKTIYIKEMPSLKYDEEAFKVTGLSKEIINQKGISEEEAIKEIVSFINRNFESRPYVLGHNVSFDLAFLEELFKRNASISFKQLVRHHIKDTMHFSHFLKDAGLDLKSLSLVSCYSCITGKSPRKAHDSLEDVLMTEELYTAQIKLMKKLMQNQKV